MNYNEKLQDVTVYPPTEREVCLMVYFLCTNEKQLTSHDEQFWKEEVKKRFVESKAPHTNLDAAWEIAIRRGDGFTFGTNQCVS